MGKVIRVTETKIWQYEPELASDFYQEHDVNTIEGALSLDREDYRAGKCQLDELVADFPEVTTTWEIVDNGIE